MATSDRLLVEGAAHGVNPLPPAPRLEISAFVRDIRQFSLYVLSLTELYKKKATELVAYFQLGGLHGRPHDDWNGTPSGGKGFCHHRTNTFLTWHRPYTVLVEQEIHRIAVLKAKEYTTADREEWRVAADRLRQPYWGWDNKDTYLPPAEVLHLKTVKVITPGSEGKKVDILNPFLRYPFPEGGNKTFPLPFNKMAQTVRHPRNDNDSEGDWKKLVENLKSTRDAVITNTSLLDTHTTWKEFSRGNDKTVGLEQIHDGIHVVVGGSGHMSVVAVSGFDPIFWLHHAQVDRILERWASKRNVWLPDSGALKPFLQTQNDYWASTNIRYPDLFNYTYDGPVSESFESEGVQWSARVRCKEFELGGSFSVVLFLGPVPSEPTAWLQAPEFAGTFDVFSNSEPDTCPNCTDHYDQVLTGIVHLNRAILKEGGQDRLEAATVVPLLKEKLNWGVQKAFYEVVDLNDFPSLEVTVDSVPLTVPQDGGFPVFGEPTYYHDITRGRAGGYPSDA